MDREQLDQMPEFKSTERVSNESSEDEPEFHRKVASGKIVAGVPRSRFSVQGSCMRHCSCLYLCMVEKQRGEV